jgi:PAS domain S-box-containing protein
MMRKIWQSTWAQYCFAALAVVLATLLRRLFDPIFGDAFPFATLFLAVVASAWFGGLGPGLVAVALGALASALFLLPPHGSLLIADADSRAGLILYCFVGTAIALLGGSMARSRALAEREAAEHRRQRDQRHESEQRFRLLADAAPVLIWMADGDQQRTYFNRTWLEFTGRNLEQETGAGWMQGLHPDDRQHCLATSTGSFAARRPFRLEYRLKNAVGEFRWLLDSGVPRFDAAGNFAGYIGSCMDITDRKEFEEDLQEQQEWLRVTLSSIGDAVIATDTEGRVLFLNGVAEALTGYAQSEAAQQPLESIFRIVNEQTRQPVENPAARALRERRVVGLANHTVLIDRQGRERPIDDSAAPIEDEAGRTIGVVLIFRDVTERRRAEEAQRRLAAIVESSDDAIVGKTLDGIITSWNAGAERIYGYSAAEIVGRPFSVLVPAQRGKEVEDTVWTLSKGRRLDHFETLRRRKDGRLIEVSVSYSPVRDKEGHLTGMSVITHDITAQRQAERCRTVRLAAAQILSQAASLQEAVPRILQVAGEELRWKVSAFWRVDSAAGALVCLDFWTGAPGDVEAFEKVTRAGVFPLDVSLPGRVWRANQPLWIADVAQDERVLRRSEAAAANLHGGLACPVAIEGDVLGVIEFFSEDVREPDAEILETMATIGAQIGQFVKRRRAEEHVRRSEQELSDFFENATIGLHWVGPDGIILRANQAELAMLGYSREEYVGRHIGEFHVDPEVIEDILARQAAGETIIHREARLKHKDGSIRDVVVDSSVLWEEGRFVHTRCFTRDITDRKAAERALQRAERMARFLADASAALAGLIDLESTLQNVARLAVPAFADWCVIDMLEEGGSIRRVAVAHSVREYEQLARDVHRRWPPQPTHGIHRIIRSGCAELIAEIDDALLASAISDPELLTITRQLGLKSFLGVPLIAHGKVSGVMEFFAAESGRRFDAEDLAVAEDLAHRAAVAIENTRLYATIKESDQRKDEFLAVLAHELRNPLAPVRNALGILRQPTATPEMQARAREMAERQVQHLTRLVDDLLDVSRIMRGKIELRKSRVDVATIAARAIETARPVIDAAGHELIVALPEAPLAIEADEVRMSQVIFNLLSNAAKYTEPGGRIELAVTGDNREVTFHIRDNGIGIAPDVLPRLFEIFVQVAPTAPRSQGGLGIGLTLVKNLVEMHGGTIDAYSAGLGQGSEFVVRLPALQPAAPASPADVGSSDARPSSSPDGSRRILVVDDNIDAATSLAMLLKLLGHETRVVHSGPDALAAVEADPPEVVLLDIGMPLMDGFEVARRLRAGPHADRLLLVAITGWGQAADRQRTKEAGFDHHLTKPVEFAMLQAVLNHRPAAS